MSVYNLSPLFKPQFVANSAAALVFATPGAPSAVPANQQYQLNVIRVANIDTVPCTLKIWRVPSGATDDDTHVVVPVINLPPASNSFPWFDVTTLWQVTLSAGDAIWAVAGTASKLIIHGDGAVVIP